MDDVSHKPATPAADTDTVSALRDEIRKTDAEQRDKSVLRTAIDFITSPYHQSSQALDQLKTLSNNAVASPTEIQSAIEKNAEARQRENDAYSIGGGVVKTLGTFTPGGIGYWLSGSVFALDEMKASQATFTDGLLGFTKGTLSRRANMMMAGAGWNPAGMSVGMGVSGRFLDTALSSSNYTDKESGAVSLASFGSGLLRPFENAADRRALTVDAATAGISYPLLKLSGGLLDGNKFRKLAATSFISGYSGGLTEELSRQQATGEYSAQRLAAYPLARAVSSSVAALPGASRQYSRDWAWEQALKTRDTEFKLVSIDGADIKRVAASRQPVEVTVRPAETATTFGEAQTVRLAQMNAPTDWWSRMGHAVRGRTTGFVPEGEQLRYISRPLAQAENPDAAWGIAGGRGFRPAAQLAQYKESYSTPVVKDLLKPFTEPGMRYLGAGVESAAVQLANGAVLKLNRIYKMEDTQNWGTSPYDARQLHQPVMFGPIKESRIWDRSLALSLQELVKTPVKEHQASALRDTMHKGGKWWFSDYNKYIRDDQVSYAVEQVGINPLGKTVMIDYGARSGPK